ncbi:MAG: VOC family protein [Thermoplasmata archaeon]|nr:VOC family protein [Thermoplasmata archaeon]
MVAGTRLTTMIPVRNMNRAVKFYTKAVGAKLEFRGRGQMKNLWASLTIGDSGVWLIVPEKHEKRNLAYTAFVVKNIKGFVKKLQGNGVKFQRAQPMGKNTKVVGPIAFDPFGASAFFRDSEGNSMMVWQESPDM